MGANQGRSGRSTHKHMFANSITASFIDNTSEFDSFGMLGCKILVETFARIISIYCAITRCLAVRATFG